MAEANGSRTHHRYRKITIAGFEDRDDHRTACASVAQAILIETKKARAHPRLFAKSETITSAVAPSADKA